VIPAIFGLVKGFGLPKQAASTPPSPSAAEQVARKDLFRSSIVQEADVEGADSQ
jgi:hypothetical protein